VHFYPDHICHLRDAECKCSLGTGGYGEVSLYQCKDRKDSACCNEYFVVKKLVLHNVSARVISEYLENEYDIGKRLNHPNIIKTIDIDHFDYCLILEYIQGIDLFEYLKNDMFSSTRALMPIFAQLIDAVHYIHDKNIVHLDIKPENILITHYDRVKLIDFGQAKLINDNDECVGVVGTENFLPPEVFTGNPYKCKTVDVWGCGVVLYNLVYKRSPWTRALINDRHYCVCKDYFDDNTLHPIKFSDKANDGFTEPEIQLLHDIFVGVFQTDPNRRLGVDKLHHAINGKPTHTPNN
jgi:serine/threonine protein kinase